MVSWLNWFILFQEYSELIQTAHIPLPYMIVILSDNSKESVDFTCRVNVAKCECSTTLLFMIPLSFGEKICCSWQ